MICLDTRHCRDQQAEARPSAAVGRRYRRGRANRNSDCCPIRIARWDSQERPAAGKCCDTCRLLAEEEGDIRAALERAGMPIGPYDVLIAAQARRRSALLVTANTSEFARVPGLKLKDWAA